MRPETTQQLEDPHGDFSDDDERVKEKLREIVRQEVEAARKSLFSTRANECIRTAPTARTLEQLRQRALGRGMPKAIVMKMSEGNLRNHFGDGSKYLSGRKLRKAKRPRWRQ